MDTKTSKGGAALVALATAQFLMVLDQSVMNVSISQLVKDFDTTVTTIQAVITLYCLVMAMLILTGAKIGDIIGRRRAFVIGLIIYACGSALTAASQTVAVLALGWSVLEGIGAALVFPALAALIAGNFEGTRRKAAYAVIGGVAGAGIAVGPIVGGWATTELTWRVVFVGEVFIAAFILIMTRKVKDAPGPTPTPKLDVVGSVLSAAGLGLFVFGVLESSTWGWLKPKNSPITIFGFSLTLFVIAAGCVVLWGFVTMAGPPRGDGPRPAHPPLTGPDPTGPVRSHRAVQPEPDPDGHLLRRPALSPTGARTQRPRHRDQDAAHLDHHVGDRRTRRKTLEPLPGTHDRPDRTCRDDRRCAHPARDDPSPRSPTPGSRSAWASSASGWA